MVLETCSQPRNPSTFDSVKTSTAVIGAIKRKTQAAVKISCATNPMSPHLSSDPGCGRELVDGVHVSLLDVDAADDELLGLLAVHVVQVERVDLGCEVASNLSRRKLKS